MNLKKILILPAGFLLSTITYIACCHCKPINKHYLQAFSLTIKPSGSNKTVVDNGTPVTMDSLYIDGSFFVDCVASHKDPFSFLVNIANACSCEGCGYKGLKSKLNSIEITSNNVFNGIPAGMSLNNYFKSYKREYYSNPAGLTIDSLKTLINKESYWSGDIEVYTKTKPANNLNHQFTMTATFANGTVLLSKTKDINWQ